MATGRDPLGKRALYSRSASELSADLDLGEGAASGPFRVECSACGRVSPISLVEVAARAVPLPLFIPFRRFPSLLRCPACDERTWVRIHWGD